MISSQVIVMGLWCADAGAAVTNNTIPHVASAIPATVVAATISPIARPSLSRAICVDRMSGPHNPRLVQTRLITARVALAVADLAYPVGPYETA